MEMTVVTSQKRAGIGTLSRHEGNMVLNSPLISGLPDGLQDELMQKGELKSYKRGGFLFMDEDPIDYVYYLMSGKAREYYITVDGSDCMRCLHAPGSYVSLHLVLSPEQLYSYSCEVLTGATFFVWRRADLQGILEQEPNLGCKMLKVLSTYVEDSCRKICLCRKNQAVSRVAGYLLSLDNRNRVHFPCCLKRAANTKFANIKPLNFSANDVCLARETFSRALSLLQERNLIFIDQGDVNILDVEGLKKVSGGL